MHDALDRRVEDLELSVRTSMVLEKAQLTYIGELVQWTAQDLLQRVPAGRKTINELEELLDQFGLKLGMELPSWLRPDGAPVVRP